MRESERRFHIFILVLVLLCAALLATGVSWAASGPGEGARRANVVSSAFNFGDRAEPVRLALRRVVSAEDNGRITGLASSSGRLR